MDYEPVVDCRIVHHPGNAPLPPDIMLTLTPDGGNERPDLFGGLLQVQMLMGRHPHSSVILKMCKAATERLAVAFPEYHDTKAFLLDRRDVWDNWVSRARFAPHPALYVPAELQDGRWSSAYLFLGTAPRAVRVRVQTHRPGAITIGVNKMHTDDVRNGCAVEINQGIEMTTGDVELGFAVFPEPDFAYAMYGRTLDNLVLQSASVMIKEPEYVSPGDWLVRRISQVNGSAVWGGWDIRSSALPGQPGLVLRIAASINAVLRPAGIRLTRARWR